MIERTLDHFLGVGKMIERPILIDPLLEPLIIKTALSPSKSEDYIPIAVIHPRPELRPKDFLQIRNSTSNLQ